VGNSWGVTLLIVAAVIVVVLVAALVISRRSGQRTAKPRQPPRRPRRVEGGERPVHLDPDPDRMAGGRARFTPPFGERNG
jgi:hypothetical protein